MAENFLNQWQRPNHRSKKHREHQEELKNKNKTKSKTPRHAKDKEEILKETRGENTLPTEEQG